EAEAEDRGGPAEDRQRAVPVEALPEQRIHRLVGRDPRPGHLASTETAQRRRDRDDRHEDGPRRQTSQPRAAYAISPAPSAEIGSARTLDSLNRACNSTVHASTSSLRTQTITVGPEPDSLA